MGFLSRRVTCAGGCNIQDIYLMVNIIFGALLITLLVHFFLRPIWCSALVPHPCPNVAALAFLVSVTLSGFVTVAAPTPTIATILHCGQIVWAWSLELAIGPVSALGLDSICGCLPTGFAVVLWCNAKVYGWSYVLVLVGLTIGLNFFTSKAHRWLFPWTALSLWSGITHSNKGIVSEPTLPVGLSAAVASASAASRKAVDEVKKAAMMIEDAVKSSRTAAVMGDAAKTSTDIASSSCAEATKSFGEYKTAVGELREHIKASVVRLNEGVGLEKFMLLISCWHVELAAKQAISVNEALRGAKVIVAKLKDVQSKLLNVLGAAEVGFVAGSAPMNTAFDELVRLGYVILDDLDAAVKKAEVIKQNFHTLDQVSRQTSEAAVKAHDKFQRVVSHCNTNSPRLTAKINKCEGATVALMKGSEQSLTASYEPVVQLAKAAATAKDDGNKAAEAFISAEDALGVVVEATRKVEDPVPVT